jgi:hypothetical protein
VGAGSLSLLQLCYRADGCNLPCSQWCAPLVQSCYERLLHGVLQTLWLIHACTPAHTHTLQRLVCMPGGGSQGAGLASPANACTERSTPVC